MKRAAFLIVLGAVCAMVGVSGYRIGRDRALTAAASDGTASNRPTRATDTAAEPLEPRPPAELVSLKEKLKHSYAACPSARYDWILRGQTAAVLATMTVAELKDLLEELMVRNPAGDIVRTGEPNMMLAADILREWGRRDPVAACMAMAEVSEYAQGGLMVFRDWLQRDPTAVERWMNSSGDDVPAALRKAWFSERVKTDPNDAVRQLGPLTPEQREKSLLEGSTSCALLPAQRSALLAIVKDEPELLEKCAGRIAGVLVDRSVEEAYAFVDSLNLDETTATSLDDGIFVEWAMQDPQVAFAAWARQQQTRLPENFLHVLDNWSLNSPGAEQAIQWMETVEAGPVKEQIQVHFIDKLARGDRYEQALRMSLSMDNREEGKRQAMRVTAKLHELSPRHAREMLGPILRDAGLELP